MSTHLNTNVIMVGRQKIKMIQFKEAEILKKGHFQNILNLPKEGVIMPKFKYNMANVETDVPLWLQLCLQVKKKYFK